MRILIISLEGGLEWACKLSLQGHEVGLWIKDPQVQLVGQGLVKRFVKTNTELPDGLEPDFDAALKWRPDLAICDVNHLTYWANQTRQQSIVTVGGTKLQDCLEDDRFGAMRWVASLGVTVPETQGFEAHEIKQAVKFIISRPDKKWVIKSDRKDKASSFIANDSEDIEPFMQQYPPKKSFIIQEKIDGIELNHEIWFAQGRPIMWIGGMEQKKFMAGDKDNVKGLGSNTGCMASYSWPIEIFDFINKIFTPKLMQAFKRLQYTGPIDMACLIDRQTRRPYFIEFTPRFGYYSITDIWEFVDTDWGQFLYDMQLGKMPKYEIHQGFGFSVGLSISPYPFEIKRFNLLNENLPINDDIRGHYWPDDAMLGQNGNLVTAGASGHIGVISSFGKTWQAARELGMRRVKSFDVSDLQYRIDSGSHGNNIDELNKLGWKIP